jgi:hypothetical protein
VGNSDVIRPDEVAKTKPVGNSDVIRPETSMVFWVKTPQHTAHNHKNMQIGGQMEK